MSEDATSKRLVLEVRGVTHAYGATEVLHRVGVAVAPGEVVAIMGPSGSGKSTLLNVVAGLLRPDEGEVILKGQRLDQLSENARSRIRLRDIGFVFQFGDLVPELTVVENVELPLQLLGHRSSVARERAMSLLARFDIEDVADHRLSELSGGEAQRAAVARALVHEPAVVLADEPTGSLDTRNGEIVIDSLLAAAREAGAAVLVVTHELRIAARADREILLRDGRVLDGAPELSLR